MTDRNEIIRRLERLDANYNLSKVWAKPAAYWGASKAVSRDDYIAGVADYVQSGLYWFVGDYGLVIVTVYGTMHALLSPGGDRIEAWRQIISDLEQTGLPEVMVYTQSKPLRRLLKRRGFLERDARTMFLPLRNVSNNAIVTGKPQEVCHG